MGDEELFAEGGDWPWRDVVWGSHSLPLPVPWHDWRWTSVETPARSHQAAQSVGLKVRGTRAGRGSTMRRPNWRASV